jgi:hypothetical protein
MYDVGVGVMQVVFSGDERRVASSSHDGTVRVSTSVDSTKA